MSLTLRGTKFSNEYIKRLEALGYRITLILTK